MECTKSYASKITFVALLFVIMYSGCDMGPELLHEENATVGLEYEYVDVNLALMSKLEQISDEDAVYGEPKIEFISDQAPINRFRSSDDFHISADLIAENTHLTGESVLIHQSLERYLKYRYLIPLSELALVNYEGKVIIEDTLYSLSGTSYTKQHIDGGAVQRIDMEALDPAQNMADYLT